MSDARTAAKQAFLQSAGWGEAVSSPLAGDASNRRYERVADCVNGRHAVLMDAPADRGEDIAPFLAMSSWLGAAGLSAPETYAADETAGFALIEDLGDDLFARIASAAPSLERPIYEAAVDLLVDIRRAAPPALKPYDASTLRREAMLALEWWRPAATGAETPATVARAFGDLIDEACADAAEDRRVVVLRDYHAENLLWLPSRAGRARVGLLDYQDALVGAPAYDLVSLLEDARRDVPPDLAEAMVARYLAASGDEPSAFRAAYAALGAQRNLKIVGIFARLWARDGKAQYLDLIPRVWAHLERDLAHPALAELAGFVRAEVPAPSADALARALASRG